MRVGQYTGEGDDKGVSQAVLLPEGDAIIPGANGRGVNPVMHDPDSLWTASHIHHVVGVALRVDSNAVGATIQEPFHASEKSNQVRVL